MSRFPLDRRCADALAGAVRPVGLGLLVAALGAAPALARGGQTAAGPSEPEGCGRVLPTRQEPPAVKGFEERVEVVAPGPAEGAAPSGLPVRPLAMMGVAGAADNVFRTLQTLPGAAATSELDSRISVRGGSPDENLTVVDGVEVHDPYRLFGLASAFNPETVRRFDLFSVKHGDCLSSLLVVENRQGSAEKRLSGSTTLALTDANVLLEGALPGRDAGSWLLTARRTYYDLLANRVVGTPRLPRRVRAAPAVRLRSTPRRHARRHVADPPPLGAGGHAAGLFRISPHARAGQGAPAAGSRSEGWENRRQP